MKSQLVRFLTTGVFITLLDFASYAFFIQLSLNPILANYFSTSIALLASFFVNKNFTFRADNNNRVRRFISFIIVTLIAIWVIQPVVIILLLPMSSSIFGDGMLSRLAPKAVATVFSTIWNYYLYKSVVFKKETP